MRIWAGCSRHLDVVAAEEEEHDVTGQAEDVKEDDQLGGAFGFQLKPFEDVASQEDANASAGDGYAAGEHAGHALGQVELRFQIFWQKDDESGHDDQLHASAQAGDNIDLVGQKLPCRSENEFGNWTLTTEVNAFTFLLLQ